MAALGMFSRDVNALPPRRDAPAPAARARCTDLAPPPAPRAAGAGAAGARPMVVEDGRLADPRTTTAGVVVAADSGADGSCPTFRVTQHLGEGGYGTVYAATHTGGMPGLARGAAVALKFDTTHDDEDACDVGAEWLPDAPDGLCALAILPHGVLREAHAYATLLAAGAPGADADAPVPRFCKAFVARGLVGRALAQPTPDCQAAYFETDVYALVLPRLGRSVYRISKAGALTVQQALALGAKMLTAVQFVHERGLLHLDIKPENFCVLNDRTPVDDAKLAIIDFGLALEAAHEAERRSSFLAQGRNPELPPLGAAPLVSDPARDGYFYGTPAYASRRAIAMLPLSYHVESVLYVVAELVSLADGGDKLPWTGRRMSERGCAGENLAVYDTGDWASHTFDGIKAMRTTADYAVFAASLPPPLRAAWDAATALRFGEMPRYDRLRAALLSQAAPATAAAAEPAASSASRKRGRNAAAAAASDAVSGPQEPNGKRLRSAIVAEMREE